MDFDFTRVSDRVRFPHCRIGLFHASTGVIKKATSGVRQADRLRGALKQLEPSLIFEIANLPTERRLRYVSFVAARETFFISATATK